MLVWHSALCEETILKFKSIEQYEYLILHLLEVTSILMWILYVSIHVHLAALSLLHYIYFLKLCYEHKSLV